MNGLKIVLPRVHQLYVMPPTTVSQVASWLTHVLH